MCILFPLLINYNFQFKAEFPDVLKKDQTIFVEHMVIMQ